MVKYHSRMEVKDIGAIQALLGTYIEVVTVFEGFHNNMLKIHQRELLLDELQFATNGASISMSSFHRASTSVIGHAGLHGVLSVCCPILTYLVQGVPDALEIAD